jgi:hypothetical protein
MTVSVRLIVCILTVLGTWAEAGQVITPSYTVTSGSLVETLSQQGTQATFSLFGPNFSLIGGAGSSSPPFCAIPPCSPGDTRGGDSITSERGGILGTLTLSGTSYPFQALPGMPLTVGLNFDYTFTVPDTGASTVTLVVPFTFSGFTEGDPTIVPDTSFTGTGNVTIVLQQFNGCALAQCAGIKPQLDDGTEYLFESATYNFTVPEPGTFVFSAIGVAFLFFVLRRLKAAN